MYIKVKDETHLLSLINDEEPTEFFILLNGGLRSSKNIMLLDNRILHIENEIDGTVDEIPIQDIQDKDLTNIGIAIKSGNFYKY